MLAPLLRLAWGWSRVKSEATVVAIGRELWHFLAKPGLIIQRRREDWGSPVGALAVSLWCSGAFVLMWAISALLFGSILEAPGGSGTGRPADQPGTVEIRDWGFQNGFHVGVALPDLPEKGPVEVQVARFGCGVAFVDIDGVVPELLTKGAFPLLYLSLLVLVLVLCLYPASRLVGGTGSFVDAARTTTLYLSYSLVFGSLVVSLWFALLREELDLEGRGLGRIEKLAIQLPLGVVLVRAYSARFTASYGLSIAKLSVASMIGVLLSVAVAPIVMIPGAYLLVRFQYLFDLFA